MEYIVLVWDIFTLIVCYILADASRVRDVGIYAKVNAITVGFNDRLCKQLSLILYIWMVCPTLGEFSMQSFRIFIINAVSFKLRDIYGLHSFRDDPLRHSLLVY
jgi:hypothetical protein